MSVFLQASWSAHKGPAAGLVSSALCLPPQQHSNASQSLCDIIRLSREQMIQVQDSPEPDQLLATLEKWVCGAVPRPREGNCPEPCTLTPPCPLPQAGDDRAAPKQHAGGRAEPVCHRERDPGAADPAGAQKAKVRGASPPQVAEPSLRALPLHLEAKLMGTWPLQGLAPSWWSLRVPGRESSAHI